MLGSAALHPLMDFIDRLFLQLRPLHQLQWSISSRLVFRIVQVLDQRLKEVNPAITLVSVHQIKDGSFDRFVQSFDRPLGPRVVRLRVNELNSTLVQSVGHARLKF